MIRGKFKALLLELVGEAIDLGIDRAANAVSVARAKASMDRNSAPIDEKPELPRDTRLSVSRCNHCKGPVFYRPVMGTRQRLIRFECKDCGVFWTMPPFEAANLEGIPL
jgi:hypothetical protein